MKPKETSKLEEEKGKPCEEASKKKIDLAKKSDKHMCNSSRCRHNRKSVDSDVSSLTHDYWERPEFSLDGAPQLDEEDRHQQKPGDDEEKHCRGDRHRTDGLDLEHSGPSEETQEKSPQSEDYIRPPELVSDDCGSTTDNTLDRELIAGHATIGYTLRSEDFDTVEISQRLLRSDNNGGVAESVIAKNKKRRFDALKLPKVTSPFRRSAWSQMFVRGMFKRGK